MRLVSIQVGCPEEIHDYWLLEIPDDWDLEELKREYRTPGTYWKINTKDRVKRLEFAEFLKERGAKELHFERFSGD